MNTDYFPAPQLYLPVETHQVRHKRVFRFSIRNSFLPKGKDNLKFELITAPEWITIATHSGIISGCTPAVTHDTPFLVTAKVSNPYGSLTHSFFIKVISTEIVDVYAHKLMDKHSEHFSDHHPYVHTPLQYIFEYIQNLDDKEKFNEILKKHATKHLFTIQVEPTFNEFKKLTHLIDPDIEAKINSSLPKNFLLNHLELTNIEFHMLFVRSQHLATSFAASAWNYFEVPDKKYWHKIWNVLSAAEKIAAKFKEEKLQEHLQHHPCRHPER